jgi:hypothetical protein
MINEGYKKLINRKKNTVGIRWKICPETAKINPAVHKFINCNSLQ